MRFDVYADLVHLYMLNYSAPADALARLVPAPLELLSRRGRGFPSVVLPRIANLRPVRLGLPRVAYELFGLRLLVEYESQHLGRTKGIYFAELVMDPNWVRLAAGMFSEFDFKRGRITKSRSDGGRVRIEVVGDGGLPVLEALVTTSEKYPTDLPPHSSFESAEEALAMYNDIAYGFLPTADGRVHVLQIADPHPNYVAWPLRHMAVEEARITPLERDAHIREGLTREPSYYLGTLPRYWRWLATESVDASPSVRPSHG